MQRNSLTKTTIIEKFLPLAQLNQLAELESYNKHLYRPATYIHKWWARRLGSVFRTILLAAFLEEGEDLWNRYYQGANFKDKIVLDPFMGGGTTVVEALRLGCKVIGVDLNPVAWWTVRSAVQPVDLNALDQAFHELESTAGEAIKAYYKTACPLCHDRKEALFASSSNVDVLFTLWVKELPCVYCGGPVSLHRSYVITRRKRSAILLCPYCGSVFEEASEDGQSVLCPYCKARFDPSQGVVKGATFVCPHCGQRQKVLEAVSRLGSPPRHKMYAIAYTCPVHGQGFKAPDQGDLELYQRAEQEFERRRAQLLFPTQEIPQGEKTSDLLKHGYRYWYQLFNKRQLICLDRLLRAILNLKDSTVRELMLTLFSGTLEFNNMFCSYKGVQPMRPGAVRHIFSHHAFVHPYESLENNLWGVGNQSGTFSGLYKGRLRRGKRYCLAPYERRIENGRAKKVIIRGERIEGRFARSFAELVNTEKNVLLLCQNSERLDLPDRSVDAVITDPPYFDNVMYSELSDFFYVWLRLALQGSYPEFEPELTPKEEEIVKAQGRGKDSKSYLEGMTQVFRECHRVLKDDGLLIFTFHHKDDEAWAIALQALLDAGFYISATYPVRSEMKLSVHIHGQEAVEYDTIIVCRKRTREASSDWDSIEHEIRHTAGHLLEELVSLNGGASKMEAFVIVMGKCLEFYSKAYPDIRDGQVRISVREALRRVQTIVRDLAEKLGEGERRCR